jgi:hypothetical protein
LLVFARAFNIQTARGKLFQVRLSTQMRAMFHVLIFEPYI